MTSVRAISGLGGYQTVGLLARDSAGVPHYYQADKGTWAARKSFTGGWGPYTVAGN